MGAYTCKRTKEPHQFQATMSRCGSWIVLSRCCLDMKKPHRSRQSTDRAAAERRAHQGFAQEAVRISKKIRASGAVRSPGVTGDKLCQVARIGRRRIGSRKSRS